MQFATPQLTIHHRRLLAGLAALTVASGLLIPFGTGWRSADLDPAAVRAGEDRAWLSRSQGAYEDAARLYLEVFAQSRPGQRVEVGQAAAEARLAAGDYAGALSLVRTLISESPGENDVRLIEAQALLGLGRPEEAEQAVLAHMQGVPLAGYGAFLAGDGAAARGDNPGSRAWYRWAIDLGLAPLWEVVALRGIAQSFDAAGDASAAAAAFERAAIRAMEVEDSGLPIWYDGDLVRRSAEARSAPLLLGAGQAFEAAGAFDDATRMYVQVSSTYPGSPEAITGLDALRDLGQYFAVAPYYRGRILLQAGWPDDATAAFTRTLETGSTYAQEAAAGYYRALAIRDLGEPRRAMDELAWTATSYPESSWAPEALWQQARIAEDRLGSDAARAAYIRVADAHPNSGRASQALARAATLASDARDRDAARAIWRRLGTDAPDTGSRAEGLFLLGKNLLQSGDRTSGMALLDRAEAVAPTSFSGLRARDVRQSGLGSEPYRQVWRNGVRGAAQGDAETCATWVSTWAGSTTTQDVELGRVDRLLRVGLRSAASAEALEAIAVSSAAQLYPLAVAFGERRLYPFSITAATRLAAASPARTIDASPACLQRLAYPRAFIELVEPQAAGYGLDPYLMLSLIRQESWFSANARSGAPALGLSQVIPATAADIARGMGRLGFRWEELVRPREAVAFGSWYLAQQIRDLGQRPLLATAAYNAGPGNAKRWAGPNLAADPDDFVQAIDFPETRTYVRSIYEHYDRYRQLYG